MVEREKRSQAANQFARISRLQLPGQSMYVFVLLKSPIQTEQLVEDNQQIHSRMNSGIIYARSSAITIRGQHLFSCGSAPQNRFIYRNREHCHLFSHTGTVAFEKRLEKFATSLVLSHGIKFIINKSHMVKY